MNEFDLFHPCTAHRPRFTPTFFPRHCLPCVHILRWAPFQTDFRAQLLFSNLPRCFESFHQSTLPMHTGPCCCTRRRQFCPMPRPLRIIFSPRLH